MMNCTARMAPVDDEAMTPCSFHGRGRVEEERIEAGYT